MALGVLRYFTGRIHFASYNSLCVRAVNVKPLLETNNTVTNENRNDQAKIKPFEELSAAETRNLNSKDAVYVLQGIRKNWLKNGKSAEIFLNDEKFQSVCSAFQKGCQIVKYTQLISGLRCLLELGLPADSKLVQTVENEVLWKSRKMSVKSLIICLDFHKNYQETQQQKTVFNTILSYVIRRWVEIESAEEIIIILRNSDIFEDEFVAKIEDRILEIADKLRVDQILLLFKALSQAKRRHTPILRALSYYLVQKQEALSFSQCCLLCFCLNSLTFIDWNLLSKIGSDGVKGLETCKSRAEVSSLITSMSLLRWDDYELLDQCCSWLERNSEKCQKKEWISLLQSLAHLNYEPENGETLFPLVQTSLAVSNKGSEEPDVAPSVWLDTVWSLAILGKASLQQLSSVLSPDFYKPLIGDEIPNSLLNKLKLENISAVGCVEFPLAKIPVLKDMGLVKVPLSTADKNLSKSVTTALETFLPLHKYLETNLQTGLGFIIDGEFIVDGTGKPVCITDYGVKAGLQKELKMLPEGYKRIAVMVWRFKDLTAKTSGLCGKNALAKRLLTKLGYTVIGIPYMEFQSLKTTVKQVMYIQEKIKQTSIVAKKD